MIRVLSYQGSQDGIRHGQISFGGLVRSYHYDRLNGTVRLFHCTTGSGRAVPDESRDRTRRALMILRDREPGEDALTEHFEGEG